MSDKKSKHPIRQGFRLAWRSLTLPFRLLLALSKATLAVTVVCLVVLNLAMPVVTAATLPLLNIGSTILEAVWDEVPPFRAQQRKVAETEKALALERGERVAAKETAKRSAAEVAAARSEARVLRKQVAGLEQELVEKGAEKILYRTERRTAAEAVSDASARVALRMEKAMATDIGSMAGQAVPYVGVAVMVGAVGYDLKLSCEMMQDLYELDVAFNPGHAVDTRAVCGMRVPTASEIWNAAKAAPGSVLQAAIDLLPDLQWQAGWKDLTGNLPSSDDVIMAAQDAMGALVGWLPEFHWQEGWEDLKDQAGRVLP